MCFKPARLPAAWPRLAARLQSWCLLTAAAGLLLACSSSSIGDSSIDPPDSQGSSSGGESSSSSGSETVTEGEGESEGETQAKRVIRGAHVLGHGIADIAIDHGLITEIGVIEMGPQEITISAEGRYIVPAGIDSHVHLDYLRAPEEMANGGIAVAVDLAAPMTIFDERSAGEFAPLQLLVAGPMLAAPGGYPTQSWGEGGFGRECADTQAALAAVDDLAERGASAIKISLENGPRLSDETIEAVIERAHGHNLKVLVHALGDSDAALAAELGVDGLAHTPLEPLSAATTEAFAGRVVISTLNAFGASQNAISNLELLRESGAFVLYGTDFGNSVTAGIDRAELQAMGAAGMDGEAILEALTSRPADFWGLAQGRLEVGAPASFLILSADPIRKPLELGAAEVVYINGLPRRDRTLGGGGIAVEPG
ncbi:MAG TPA: hypothetical protein ENK31_08195 [Nannocystis exedens]|nr:hypothetical protein [Nannocystis exedens]